MRALWILAVLPSCTSYAPAAAPKREPVCIRSDVRVIDEAKRPLAGARVRTTMAYRKFGPSGLPEGSFIETEESPVVVTGADGMASVCKLDMFRDGELEVSYRDWPLAKRSWHEREVMLGPPRAALVQVPDDPACPDPKRLQVAAYATPIPTQPVIGVERPARSFTLANLGPWRYWVRSTSCGRVTLRLLDGREVPPVLAMDHNDGAILLPDFAGATATATVMDDPTPVATTTLGADGSAVLALPGSTGTVYCLTLVKDDRCAVTFTRAGEIATPNLYADRTASLARCGGCAPPR